MLVQSWTCKNFWTSIENNRTGETLERFSWNLRAGSYCVSVMEITSISMTRLIAIQRTKEYSRRCWHTTRPWDREVRRYGTFERYGIHHALLGVRRLISSRPVIKCGYPFLAFINPARTFSRRNAIESMRMRDKVVVSQDGAEKIEGYFRQVIFDTLFFNWSIFLIVNLGMDEIWNKFLKWTFRLTKNIYLYYIYRMLSRFAIVCKRLCVRKKTNTSLYCCVN